MTVTLPETDELYRRYKTLTLAAGAAILLGSPLDALVDAVDELGRDAEGTLCAAPATALRKLVLRAGAGEATDTDLEQVRASHRSLRRAVWTTQPCEYVPCCAGGRHDHR
jgi:hypothetical protein